ncbi:protein EI24 homolog isoform X1 [Phoenix dactylifera]|uniref:Protein EI24 homolog isoform X1 n=1 Tax=Phoenix dactylifera TaxID=42345 RepID=A0A8B7BMF5_PHODC|nr:protein EI24 homolog isoform X1 [Phoenix dactylifera]
MVAATVPLHVLSIEKDGLKIGPLLFLFAQAQSLNPLARRRSSGCRTMDALASQAKQAGRLWLAGFTEACSLHRVVIFCLSSKMLSIRTGQCFLLNGFIFLGSLFTLKSAVIPTLMWILPDQCEKLSSQSLCDHKAALALYSFLRFILVQIFYIFWFYPLYVFSFILCTLWYNDIAKNAFDVLGKQGPSNAQIPNRNDLPDSQSVRHMGRPGGFERVLLGIGEQVYSILLLNIFFIEIFAMGFIPYIGKAINFLLLSLMYAYYCFEYKWNFSEKSLNERLEFFESNWSFFAGFGSPCVLPILFFSTLVSYGIMAMLYPLFVLTAAGTQSEEVIDFIKGSWGGGGPRKLRLFYAADKVSMLVLQLFPKVSKEH